MEVIEQNVPEVLRSLKRWVCWSWLWNPRKNGGRGGCDKPPLNAVTGRNASSTDPNTWSDFETAFRAYQRGDFDGIGITLGKIDDTGLTLAGLDLDDVRDPTTGQIEPWALYFLHLLDSYSELSPSGTGVKALAFGTLPRGQRDNGRGIECYDGGRYFTLTGQHLVPLPTDVMKREEALMQVHDIAFAKAATPTYGVRLSDRELALAALAGIHKQRATTYGDWIGVGMALHSVSDDLLDDWDKWSQSCPDKYEPGACAEKWASFRGCGRGITLGTLIFWAKQDGWAFPSRNGHAANKHNSSSEARTADAHGTTSGAEIAPDGLRYREEPFTIIVAKQQRGTKWSVRVERGEEIVGGDLINLADAKGRGNLIRTLRQVTAEETTSIECALLRLSAVAVRDWQHFLRVTEDRDKD
jgi:hypothetical protein